MAIDPGLLDEVRARADLAGLVAQSVALKRAGGRDEWAGLCPFHAERSPSFTVSGSKGFYHCFGCGAHGDAIDWLCQQHGMSFVDAVEELAVSLGLAVDREGRRRPQAPVRRVMEAPVDDDARERERVRDLWRGAVAAAGTLVETYLRAGRGLDLDAIGGVPACLRFAAALPYWQAGPDDRPAVVWRGPAMVAPIARDRRLIGVHLTWLEPDGGGKLRRRGLDGKPLKAKKMKGRHMGGVIPLAGRAAARMQGGEGIETALSGWCAVPGLPAVALGSLGNFAGHGRQGDRGPAHPAKPGRFLSSPRPDPARPGWLPPPEVREFTWLVDADSSDPSVPMLIERGLARYAAAGLRVRRAAPPPGLDMNDLYREAG